MFRVYPLGVVFGLERKVKYPWKDGLVSLLSLRKSGSAGLTCSEVNWSNISDVTNDVYEIGPSQPVGLLLDKLICDPRVECFNGPVPLALV